MINNGTFLPCPVTVSNGAGQDASAFGPKTIFVWGTFVGTYQAQISGDGVHWDNEGTAFTAQGNQLITKPCLQVRMVCTAYTSGQAIAVCYGQQNTVKG